MHVYALHWNLQFYDDNPTCLNWKRKLQSGWQFIHKI